MLETADLGVTRTVEIHANPRREGRVAAGSAGEENGSFGTTSGGAAMVETYTNGIWLVKEGHEDEFVAAWREFASWGHTWPGCGTLRLVRDHHEPKRFMSFGPWESFEAQQAWKDDPEFKERIGRVRQHTEDFTPSVFEHVTAVD